MTTCSKCKGMVSYDIGPDFREITKVYVQFCPEHDMMIQDHPRLVEIQSRTDRKIEELDKQLAAAQDKVTEMANKVVIQIQAETERWKHILGELDPEGDASEHCETVKQKIDSSKAEIERLKDIWNVAQIKAAHMNLGDIIKSIEAEGGQR